MNLLRIALLCAAMTSLAGGPSVRAEDQPTQPNAQAATEQSPPVHCEGQNCLPPAEDPVLDCKGQDCKPSPATDQTPGPEIQKAK